MIDRMKTPLILLVVAALEVPVPLAVLGSPSGKVLGWGSNTGGQATGIPSSGQATGFVQIASQPLTDIVAVTAGRSHSLALRSDGTVSGWGFNPFGQATGLIDERSPEVASGPVRVGGQMLRGVAAVSAGDNISLALLSNATVVAWGSNLRQGLDVPLELTNAVAIAAGWTHCLALKRDGTVTGWGSPAPPPGLSNIVAVAAGRSWYANSLALKSDGTVIEWGPNGELSTSPSGLSNVVAVSVGANFSLALRKDGTVFGWGGNGSGQATGTPTTNSPYWAASTVELGGHALTNIVAIAAGGEYGLALKEDGEVVVWGDPRSCKGVPSRLTNAVAISAGGDYCLAITTNTVPFVHKR